MFFFGGGLGVEWVEWLLSVEGYPMFCTVLLNVLFCVVLFVGLVMISIA